MTATKLGMVDTNAAIEISRLYFLLGICEVYKRTIVILSHIQICAPKKMNNFMKNIYQFYYQGFKSMTLGKRLWAIILIKLIIIFVVLRFFFFPNFLKSNFTTDEERSKHVIEQLTK